MLKTKFFIVKKFALAKNIALEEKNKGWKIEINLILENLAFLQKFAIVKNLSKKLGLILEWILKIEFNKAFVMSL